MEKYAPDAETIEISTAAATLGRKGGASKSPAKQAAVRENGRKGGRPRGLRMDVVAKKHNGQEMYLAEQVTEAVAVRIATREAAQQHDDQNIFIRWFRASDGQHGYLNRDGHSPVGKAW